MRQVNIAPDGIPDNRQGGDPGHRRRIDGVPADLSTGHLIVASSLLNFTGEKVPTFEIAIQTGAMFAVIWEYRAKLSATVAGIFRERTAQRFAINVGIAFAPAVVFGLALGGLIKAQLFHPVPVALAFVIGGFVILWVERRHHRMFGERDLEGVRVSRVESVDDMSPLDALKVGLVQCAALIPGTSRSGATIMAACCSACRARQRLSSVSTWRSRR